MDASVSLPDPGEFHRGSQNGHAAGLAIDQLRPFGPAGSTVDEAALGDLDLLRSPGVLPLDAADVGEVLAESGLDLGPRQAEEQTRILEAELRAELERLDIDELREEAAQAPDNSGESYCNLARDAELLPGCEALTWSDLRHCPDWCSDADLPGHDDGFDTIPEPDVPHRGVPHDILIKHGGKSLDHAGRAEVSVQLEQDRDLATGPVITLSVVVRGIEQYAWLTIAEAMTLHRTLGQLLADTNDQR